MNAQMTGLATATGAPYALYPVRIRWPWSLLPVGWLPKSSTMVRGLPAVRNDKPPRLVISCGRHGVIPSVALKRRYGQRIFTVHIQDPRIATKHFDLVVAPRHDAVRGENVYQTMGALHHLTPQRLAQAARSEEAQSIRDGARRLVAVLVGGRSGGYDFTPSDATALACSLKKATRRRDVRLVILGSNRTPPAVMDVMRNTFATDHFVWDGIGPNPYLAALALASHIVVTSDSVSMVSEAAATGAPVFVHHLPLRRQAARLADFHQMFEQAGITRTFEGQLDDWQYVPPSDTPRVAALIRERLSLK